MEYLQVLSVPVIAVIVYWVINLIKYAVGSNETFKRFIPLLSGFLGAALGAICFFFLPDIIAAPNALVAVISGAASGLTATGCNQIIKQFTEKEGVEAPKTEVETPDKKTDENDGADSDASDVKDEINKTAGSDNKTEE
jgi:hypothetical protein